NADRPAQHLLGGVAEQGLGGSVPAGHQPLRGGDDHRVGDAVEDQLCAIHQVPAVAGLLACLTSSSQRTGIDSGRQPIAWRSALATAAGPGTAGGSPTPLAPYGP